MEEKLMSMGTYVDPFVIKVLLCDSINNEVESIFDYEQVKEYVKSLKINVAKEEVDAFLDKEFEKDCPEVRTRIKNDDYSNIVEKITDKLKAREYMGNDTYEYFTRYIDVLREKSLKLLNIVDILISIKNKNIDKDTDISILSELDIEVIDGNILYNDMIRIINPIVENICDLKKYVDSANDFNSYLHVNISKDLVYLSGENYDDLFPSRKLQVNDLLYDKSLRGYVPLTDKQKQDIIVKDRKNYEYVLKFTDDLK